MSYSEESRTKCIGLTIETRPDYCLTPHLKDMLSYGCTRLEMGVQSIYEDVARDTNRSVHHWHGVALFQCGAAFVDKVLQFAVGTGGLVPPCCDSSGILARCPCR